VKDKPSCQQKDQVLESEIRWIEALISHVIRTMNLNLILVLSFSISQTMRDNSTETFTNVIIVVAVIFEFIEYSL
jgi:hypothetical protein